jgi:hypothetical protein
MVLEEALTACAIKGKSRGLHLFVTDNMSIREAASLWWLDREWLKLIYHYGE